MEPGWVHEAIGGVALKVLQAIAEKNGVNLSVGDITKEDITPPSIGDEDGPQPQEVAARLVAHIGHRVPIVRKVTKRFEGKDRTSGIGSDFAALFAQLWVLNKDQIEEVVTNALATRKQRRREDVVPGEEIAPGVIVREVPHGLDVEPQIVGNGGIGNA